MMDDRIKFRHLQCFLAVVQHGSLQKASGALSITQPAVSKTLKELEALLAVRLLERGRRGAVLTAVGETFARHAAASVAALREGVASVHPSHRPAQALVTLGVLPTVAPQLGPALLRQLDASSSGRAISLRLHTGANPTLLTQLRQGELDMVIGRFAEPTHMRGLTFEHLHADPLVLAVRPSHPLLAQAEPLDTLQTFTLMLPMPGTAIRQSADNFLQTRGVGRLQRTVETLDVSVAHGYTRASDAVWLCPLGAVAHDLADGSLVALNVPMTGTEERVGLRRVRAHVGAQAQAEVMTALRQVAGRG
jgi:LysR family transcriptional regulator, pca operon transcriptional activator